MNSGQGHRNKRELLGYVQPPMFNFASFVPPMYKPLPLYYYLMALPNIRSCSKLLALVLIDSTGALWVRP